MTMTKKINNDDGGGGNIQGPIQWKHPIETLDRHNTTSVKAQKIDHTKDIIMIGRTELIRN